MVEEETFETDEDRKRCGRLEGDFHKVGHTDIDDDFYKEWLRRRLMAIADEQAFYDEYRKETGESPFVGGDDSDDDPYA